jgi:putative transposase
VTFYRRRLPHTYETQQPVFLTFRLYGSLPPNRPFRGISVNSGKAFAAVDHLLDEGRSGPLYLSQPELAEMVVDAVRYHERVLARYLLHAFVVMPNHVHMLITPKVPLPELTKSLKSFTPKRANLTLGRTGNSFWQEESYDHLVRDGLEFARIRGHIENNPVRAGMVREPEAYLWSSAGEATRRSGRPLGPDEAVRPTMAE